MTVIIADYGMGNISSVANMLRKIDAKVEISSDPDIISRANKLILPGVGAFDKGMGSLTNSGIKDAIISAAGSGCRVLGICLGMQLLMEGSEEGRQPGLGLVPGWARRFPAGSGALKVPHMGWNYVHPKKESLLFNLVDDQLPRFYFVHSYFVSCESSLDVIGVSNYGFEFTSAICRGNVYGVQFHPEKSHRFGMRLLYKFIAKKNA